MVLITAALGLALGKDMALTKEARKKPPADTGGWVVLRRATPRALSQSARRGCVCQPSTFTVTVVALWALGAFTVSRPPW